MTPSILITNPVHAEVRDRLAQYGKIVVNEAIEPWSAADIAARIADADAMMGFMTDRVDAPLLGAAPKLRIVAAALKGFDSYDVDACTRAGVWLSIVPDLLTEPTAELAIGLAISLARQVRAGDQQVRSGAFQGWRAQLYGAGLNDAVVAVVGLGHVGSAIIRRLAGFGCREILGVDPRPSAAVLTRCDLATAMARADFVLLAAPLSANSRALVDAACLAAAKPGQFLVNVGRGSVVDETAVADALHAGTLAGYAADVFAFEDWGLPDRPATVPAALRAHANTLFTPHLGSAVRAVRLAIEQRAADNIIAVLQGREPPDAINRVPPRAA